jgi:hypothetical protein
MGDGSGRYFSLNGLIHQWALPVTVDNSGGVEKVVFA